MPWPFLLLFKVQNTEKACSKMQSWQTDDLMKNQLMRGTKINVCLCAHHPSE